MLGNGPKDRPKGSDFDGSMQWNRHMMFSVYSRRHVHMVSLLTYRLIADSAEAIHDLLAR
jgi:hypothetical protein